MSLAGSVETPLSGPHPPARTTVMSALGVPIAGPPADGITRLRFSLYSDLLLASSWDTTVRLYDTSKGQPRATFRHRSPILDCCLQYEASIYLGGLEGQVKQLDIATGRDALIGSHTGGVKCIEFLADKGLIATGSWDQSLRVWDPRLPNYQSCVATLSMPGKVYTMSTSMDRIVVGCSGRHVWVYELRRLESGQAEQHRESSLKYQTRCIACYPDGQGYALGSVEGRVAMEYFDLSNEAQANKYAFKCHRLTENGKEVTYPVNAIAFHPTFGTFATGGGDGVVNLWDGANKKRLHQISRYPTSVSSLAFNRDGSVMAVASSYTFEFGEKDHPGDEIYLRQMQDSEIKPKPRGQPK